MNRIIISVLAIANLFFVVTSCTNKNDELNSTIDNVKVAFSDSLLFEISEDTNSIVTPHQSLVLWYWNESSVMFKIRPDSLNIRGAVRGWQKS